MSDNSESWSSSSSFYNGRLGSYPPIVWRPVNRVQRFMQSLRVQFKGMKCAKSSAPSSQEWYNLVSSDSDSDITLYPLPGPFKPNIQRSSVYEIGPEETVKTINMEIQIRSPGTSHETIMYETKDFTSSSNNGEGASNIKFKDGSLAAIILSKEPAFINLNFPQLDELMESLKNSNDSDEEKTLDGQEDGQVSQDFAGNGSGTGSVTNLKGQMRVFKSGRATLSFGSKVFVLAKAAESEFHHEVVCDMEDRERSMGFVKHYIDVLPQEEAETSEIELQ